MSEKENELYHVILTRRVAKVVEGGRNFKISVLVVLGDGNGRVGFGLGKAIEHSAAVEKAKNHARRNLVKIDLLNNRTINYNVTHKFKACKVQILRANQGHGIIAGNTMRSVFEVLGIKDIIAKVHQSHNPVNLVPCTIQALQKTMRRIYA